MLDFLSPQEHYTWFDSHSDCGSNDTKSAVRYVLLRELHSVWWTRSDVAHFTAPYDHLTPPLIFVEDEKGTAGRRRRKRPLKAIPQSLRLAVRPKRKTSTTMYQRPRASRSLILLIPRKPMGYFDRVTLKAT